MEYRHIAVTTIISVPMKPKFTDQLITGKGLPEVQSVEQIMQSANNVLTKAASLDLPSPTKVNITPVQHKQYSLGGDVRPKGHSECQSRIGGDIHPMKLADTHLSVKEPGSPSHSEVDRVKKLPGKGKESSHKIKKNKSPSTKKPKESQRKTSLSLSDLLHERKAAVASKIKRKFSRSDADTKDEGMVARRLHVGKATSYNTGSVDNLTGDEITSSNSDAGSNLEDVFGSNSTSDEGTKTAKNVDDNVDVSNTASVTKLLAAEQSVETAENIHDNSASIETKTSEVTTIGDNNTESVSGDDVYEIVEFASHRQELYENAELVTKHEKGTNKLVSVPVIEIETVGNGSNNPIGPSQDYIPMNVSGSGDYDCMNQADSHSRGSTLRAYVYDNAEFDTQMYDNSLYDKNKSESVYEAYEFHKARELRAISRRSRFRKMAKKQKPILLEDDKYEPVNEQQAEGNVH